MNKGIKNDGCTATSAAIDTLSVYIQTLAVLAMNVIVEIAIEQAYFS